MKKIKSKQILITLAVITLCFFCHMFYTMHHSVFNDSNDRHLFIFKDSVLENINKPSFSWVADQDTLTHFVFSEYVKNKKDYYEYNDTCNNFYIDVWEFNTLKNYELDDVFINEHSKIEKSKFSFGETLNGDGPFSIPIRYLYNIDGMIINLGENSKVIKEFRGVNYKGFYGLIDKISICDKKGEPQIYFDFETKLKPTVLMKLMPTILILYKGHNGFYLIKINSSIKLDENVINILNLK